MQVIGLCRFSYPALGGFQTKHDTPEERMRYLYDTGRMNERLKLFETITLPGLKAQTDPDFIFLVLVGDSMPAVFRTRLETLLKGFPQARIITRPPENHREVCKSVINTARDLTLPCIQFRHDDDDALAVNYVARLRKTASDCAGLLRDHRMVGIDFNRGYVARVGPQGITAAEKMKPYWGVALAVAVQAGLTQTVMNFAHNRLARFMTTITYTDSPMYVRTYSGFNDHARGDPGNATELIPLRDPDKAYFRKTFAIDADHAARVFAGE